MMLYPINGYIFLIFLLTTSIQAVPLSNERETLGEGIVIINVSVSDKDVVGSLFARGTRRVTGTAAGV
jgi:hypothetical protein